MSKLGLVVTHPFEAYAVGDLITDADAMAKASDNHPAHVVRRVLTDAEINAPAPAAVPVEPAV